MSRQNVIFNLFNLGPLISLQTSFAGNKVCMASRDLPPGPAHMSSTASPTIQYILIREGMGF